MSDSSTHFKVDFKVPENPSLERDLLGSVLIGGYHAAKDLGVTSEWFYDPRNIEVWQACNEVEAQGGQVDQVSVTSKAKRQALYIDDLCGRASTAANVELFAKELAGFHVRRKAFLSHFHALEACQATEDTQELQKRLEEAFYELTDGVVRDKDQREAKKAFVDLLQSALPNGVPQRGGMTGMLEVDELLTGLKEGSMNTLAARPGRGKTSLAVQIAIETALRGEHVAFYSFEMPFNQIYTKALSYLSRVDVDYYLRTGQGPTENIAMWAGKLTQLPLHIEDDPGLTVHDIASQVRRLSKEHGTKLVVVDYLQLIGSGRQMESRVNEIGIISRELKKCFMQTGVPGLVLAQMNRSIEGREGKPKLSDLRESGSIEQDSDTVMFLHDNPELDTDLTELVIKKNRHGRTGSVPMSWEKSFGRFRPLSNEELTNEPTF
jgi:replicative DNA helicase